jgi:hypothetical protein
MLESNSNSRTTQRVLVVAYVFPPVGGAGVQRVTKFVKYLPEFGWEATVLTTENPSVPLTDESLLADVPPQTKIVRAKTLEPGYAFKRSFLAGNVAHGARLPASSNSESNNTAQRRSTGEPPMPRMLSAVKAYAKRFLRGAVNLLLQPDPQVLWNHQAIEAGLRILSQEKHDAIFVTAPPFSSLLVGAELSRRTGLPLVLDYRDEWGISNAYWENRQQGYFTRWLQSRMQRRVVRSAAALVATTRHSADALRTVAAEAGTRPLVTHIYNGYDADDLHSSANKPPLLDPVVEAGADRETYKLSYVGTLWNLTTVEPIVRAVQLLSEQSPELAARLELHFAGRRTGPQDELLNQLNGLPCRVTRQPYVDHDEAVKLMQTSDGLCLLLADLPDAGRVVPGKLFEYMAVRKPIFAVTPPGEVADLLFSFPLGFVHSPSDIAGLAQRLGDEIERKRLGIPLPVGLQNAEQFERRQLTSQLAKIFDAVTMRNTVGIRRSMTVRSIDTASRDVENKVGGYAVY